MRILGLDVGDKRIGVALSDPLGITAQGLDTIERVGIRKDCDKVIALVKEFGCDRVVIGLNKRLDGSDTPQTEKVYEFKDMLANKMRSIKLGDVEIIFQDERLSTVEANKILIQGDVSREKRKTVIDKQAAIIILQRYLDRLSFENKL